MRLARSGSRGVFWRASLRGSQEVRRAEGTKERGDWWVRWACTHGHVHRALVGAKGRAQQEAERCRVERSCPKHRPKPASYLLTDVITEYLEAARGHKRSWRDDARYGKVWAARFPGRTLEDITPLELERVRTERLQTVTPATVNREMAYLKHLFNLAIRDEKTERNPAAKLKMLREPSGRVRFLTDEEERALRGALATDEDRERLTVLLQTGLRKSEFLELRWRDMDLKNGVITIPRSKNGETRHVPMTSEVRAILSKRPRALDSASLVFPNTVSYADHHWAEKAFPEAVESAQIEDFRLHDTRHTFASRLAMEGVDLLTIKELGGWKSLTMVERYAHLSPGHRQKAIERLVSRRPATHQVQSAASESHRE